MVDTPKRYEPMKNIVITGWIQYTKDRRKTIITNCFGSKGVSEIIHHFPVKLFFKIGKKYNKNSLQCKIRIYLDTDNYKHKHIGYKHTA